MKKSVKSILGLLLCISLISLVISCDNSQSLDASNAFDLDASKEVVSNENELSIALLGDAEVITLSDNISLDNEVVISRKVTLDLNGKKLSRNSDSPVLVTTDEAELTIIGKGRVNNTNGQVLRIEKGSVEIQNGIFTTVNGNAAIALFNDSNLVIKGGSFRGKYYAVATNNLTIPNKNEKSNSNLTIYGGNFDSEEVTVFYSSNGNLNIKGGYFALDSEGDGIVIKAGKEVLVENASFKSQLNPIDESVQINRGNGWDKIGCALALLDIDAYKVEDTYNKVSVTVEDVPALIEVYNNK